jgi:hypothetical protein
MKYGRQANAWNVKKPQLVQYTHAWLNWGINPKTS